MDIGKLYTILGATTTQLRKGEEVVKSQAGNIAVVEIYAMPKNDDPAADNLEKVDLHFLTIGVDKRQAEDRRADLIEILNDWPNDELSTGPSYIAVGGTIGDQGAAFQLFALGKALGLWSIITPATFGMTGDEASRAAGGGFIMISGYQPAQLAA